MNYAELGISKRNKRGQDEWDFKVSLLTICDKLLAVSERVTSTVSPNENYHKFVSSALFKSVVKCFLYIALLGF